MLANVFFVAVELYTALYSGIPEQVSHFAYLFLGLDGDASLAPWMWASAVLAVVSLVLLLSPGLRRLETSLVVACVAVVASLWLDKGLGMVVAGFVPSPLGRVAHYSPTAPELAIGLGIWAVGLLIVTVLVRIVLVVRGHLAHR